MPNIQGPKSIVERIAAWLSTKPGRVATKLDGCRCIRCSASSVVAPESGLVAVNGLPRGTLGHAQTSTVSRRRTGAAPVLTVAPCFARNVEPLRSCAGDRCTDLPPQGSNVVYLRTEPRADAPLVGDPGCTRMVLRAPPGSRTGRPGRSRASPSSWPGVAASGRRSGSAAGSLGWMAATALRWTTTRSS